MTDLQSRLKFIEQRVDEIKQGVADITRHQDLLRPVSELCYLVGYLAKIVEKHLETGEK